MDKNLSLKIFDEIKNAKKILLHCHPSSDPDSVGSVLAMKMALEGVGLNVIAISGDDKIPEEFDFPGVKDILNKNFLEMDLNDFDMFISLDSSSTDMISAKATIIFPEHLKVIVIDHHRSNTKYGHLNLVEPSIPATAQLLYELFKIWNINLTRDICLNLFMGIYTDTGGFQYESVTHRTFEIATELVSHAPDFHKTLFTMNNSNKKDTFIFEGLALSGIREYLDGKVMFSMVSMDQMLASGIDIKNVRAFSISNKVKSIIGVQIGVSMYEIEKNVVKVSFRTRDSERYDLSKIASALGGGGHKAAAGVRLKMSIDAAEKIVLEKVKEIYKI